VVGGFHLEKLDVLEYFGIGMLVAVMWVGIRGGKAKGWGIVSMRELLGLCGIGRFWLCIQKAEGSCGAWCTVDYYMYILRGPVWSGV
jgi:hypothetical protein